MFESATLLYSVRVYDTQYLLLVSLWSAAAAAAGYLHLYSQWSESYVVGDLLVASHSYLSRLDTTGLK